jgi:hypothetical protein
LEAAMAKDLNVRRQRCRARFLRSALASANKRQQQMLFALPLGEDHSPSARDILPKAAPRQLPQVMRFAVGRAAVNRFDAHRTENA